MALYLPPNLAALARVAGADGRLALGCLRVVDLGGAYRVEATDGRRLAIAQGESADLGYPPLAAVEESGGGGAVLVPRECWRAAFQLAGKRDPAVGLAVGPDGVLFAGPTTFRQVSPEVDGRFPDVDTVLPTAPPLVQIPVNAQLLAELLTVAAVFADAEQSHRAELLYYGRGKPLGVSTRNGRQFFDGLLMLLS
jgi:DNA polymerase III sliding clamp (beta) subunit (PCNA family)